MGSTYLSLHYHLIFSTKNREPLIAEAWREQLHEYLGGTIRGLGGISEGVGGIADHVHLLVSLKATHCLADVLREFGRTDASRAAVERALADFEAKGDVVSSARARALLEG